MIDEATTFIYGLKVPGTDEIRYVGKADDPSKRLEQHLQHHTPNKLKRHWIETLQRRGVEPEVIILEEVVASMWKPAERRWIRQLKDGGHKLLNVDEGGHGGVKAKGTKVSKNFRLSDETLVALKHLSGRWGVSQGKTIEILVREAAIEEKLL